MTTYYNNNSYTYDQPIIDCTLLSNCKHVSDDDISILFNKTNSSSNLHNLDQYYSVP